MNDIEYKDLFNNLKFVMRNLYDFKWSTGEYQRRHKQYERHSVSIASQINSLFKLKKWQCLKFFKTRS